MFDDFYKDLANAIIIQAATDYRQALRQLACNEDYVPAVKTKRECERFFHSAWFRLLTNADTKYLLTHLVRDAS